MKSMQKTIITAEPKKYTHIHVNKSPWMFHSNIIKEIVPEVPLSYHLFYIQLWVKSENKQRMHAALVASSLSGQAIYRESRLTSTSAD